jgi:hypothetical protein
MSVQWIACPECAFKMPYAVLGKRGSFRTGSEFATLCRHLSGASSTRGLDCPVLRAEAERVLGIRWTPAGSASPMPPETGE